MWPANPPSLPPDSPFIYCLDVKWFVIPEGARDWNPRIRCPVVMRTYQVLASTGGNFWNLGGIIPVKVVIASHHEDREERMWQVLPSDSFLLPNMCNSSPSPSIYLNG